MLMFDDTVYIQQESDMASTVSARPTSNMPRPSCKGQASSWMSGTAFLLLRKVSYMVVSICQKGGVRTCILQGQVDPECLYKENQTIQYTQINQCDTPY